MASTYGETNDGERLIDQPASELLKKFGAGEHKPGSGSAAALQGMLSAQLLRTVIAITADPTHADRYAAALPRLQTIKLDVERRLIPGLERLFQEDSEYFDNVFHLRKRRDAESDPVIKRKFSQAAIAALVPATDTPIRIAEHSLELARYALEVLDNGFQSARGDSGVALSAALSAAFGALSIVELNLQSTEEGEWASAARSTRKALIADVDAVAKEARQRLAQNVDQTRRRADFSAEVQAIAASAKGRKNLSELEIEAIAIRLQTALWKNRDWIWKDGHARSAFDVLDPYKVLKNVGLLVDRPSTLGVYDERGATLEVAGQIDQLEQVVSISRQFPVATQRFTASHELGHHFLHSQKVLHRDRPLDRLRATEPRDSEEWQADKFASYFLMPRKLVKAAFAEVFLTEQFTITPEAAFALNERSPAALLAKCKSLRELSRFLAMAGSYNGKQFKPLFERFNVSVEAFAIRLEELNLLRY